MYTRKLMANRITLAAMETLPNIHLIMTEDAGFHAGIIEKIMKNLQAESRIKGFYKLTADADFNSMEDGDVLMLMLTERTIPQLPVIQNKLRFIKSIISGLQAIGILVDNPETEADEFLIFPKDRISLRERKDWEQAWTRIEEGLRRVLPEKKENPSSSAGKSQLKIIISLLVLLVAAIVFYLNQNGRTEPENGDHELFWDEANWNESEWQ